MDVKEKIDRLINYNISAEDVSFDDEYQKIFRDEGIRKSKYILEALSTNGKARNEDLAKYVFISIGGADGSEAEAILRDTRISKAISLEISDDACDKARQRGKTISNELNKDLIVVQGDATQRLPDVLRHMEKLKHDNDLVGMVLSAQAVIHELPRRSPNFRISVFFGQLFRVFENNMFFGREPIKTERWPDIVELKVGNASSESLVKLATIINDSLSITDLNATPIANGFINIDSTLALELLHKLIRAKSVSEFTYELDEQLTSLDPDVIKRTIENHIGYGTTTVEPTTTDGFKEAWEDHSVEVKDEQGGRLSFPITHARIISISTHGGQSLSTRSKEVRKEPNKQKKKGVKEALE